MIPTTVAANSINELYADLCHLIMRSPDFESAPRGMKIKECLNTTLVLNNPELSMITIPEKKFSKKYLAGEFAFYFSGSKNLNFINKYSKFWNKCSDDGETVNSCYGRILMYEKNGDPYIDNFSYAYKQLMKDKYSRKAVMTIYRSHKNNVLDSNDNPCTMYLQFFIRSDKLHLHTYMRSNDIWFGLPYDIPFFTMLQLRMFSWLKESGLDYLKLGHYYHNVGSLHMYGRDADKIEEVINSNSPTCKESCRIPEYTTNTDKEMRYFSLLEHWNRTDNQRNKKYKEIISDPLLQTMYEYIIGGK